MKSEQEVSNRKSARKNQEKAILEAILRYFDEGGKNSPHHKDKGESPILMSVKRYFSSNGCPR